MLIDSNDRQTLHDANGSYEPGSTEWQTAYTQRIETIAGMFRDKKIPLIWVGLPILKSERLHVSMTSVGTGDACHSCGRRDARLRDQSIKSNADSLAMCGKKQCA